MTRRARTMGIIPSGTIQVSESVYFPCVFKQLLNEIIRSSLITLLLESSLALGHGSSTSFRLSSGPKQHVVHAYDRPFLVKDTRSLATWVYLPGIEVRSQYRSWSHHCCRRRQMRSNEWEWFFPQSIAIPRQCFAGGTPAVNRNLD